MLKKELGFDGFIVSDWAAIDQLSGDYKTAIEKSINAGIDMVMIPNGPGKPNNYVEFITQLKELVHEGKVPESRIDDAARRILLVKARMHLADHPFSDPALTSAVGSAEHRAGGPRVRPEVARAPEERQGRPSALEAGQAAGRGGPGGRRPGHPVRRLDHQVAGQDGPVTHGGTTILAGGPPGRRRRNRRSTAQTGRLGSAAARTPFSSWSASGPTPR